MLEMKLDQLEKYEMMISNIVVEENIELSLFFTGKTRDTEFEKLRTITTKPIPVGATCAYANPVYYRCYPEACAR